MVGAPTVTVPVLSRISVSTSEARFEKVDALDQNPKALSRPSSPRPPVAGPATTNAVGVGDDQDRDSRETGPP